MHAVKFANVKHVFDHYFVQSIAPSRPCSLLHTPPHAHLRALPTRTSTHLHTRAKLSNKPRMTPPPNNRRVLPLSIYYSAVPLACTRRRRRRKRSCVFRSLFSFRHVPFDKAFPDRRKYSPQRATSCVRFHRRHHMTAV